MRYSPKSISALLAFLFFLVSLNTLASDLERANKSYAQGSYLDAMTNYSAIIDAGEGSAAAYYGLGASQFMLGNLDAAEAALRKAIQIRPTFEQAQLFLQRTLKQKDPQLVRAFRDAMERGSERYGHQSLLEAFVHFSKAVQINPYSPDAHYFLGLIYEKLGPRADAIKQFAECLKLDPYFEGAQYHLRGLFASGMTADESKFALLALQRAEITSQAALNQAIPIPASIESVGQSPVRFLFLTSGGMIRSPAYDGQSLWSQGLYGGLLYGPVLAGYPLNFAYVVGGSIVPQDSFVPAVLDHRINMGVPIFAAGNFAGRIGINEELVFARTALISQVHSADLNLSMGEGLNSYQLVLGLANSYYPTASDYNANSYTISFGGSGPLEYDQVISVNLAFGNSFAENTSYSYNAETVGIVYSWSGWKFMTPSIGCTLQTQNYPQFNVAGNNSRMDILTSGNISVAIAIWKGWSTSIGFQTLSDSSNIAFFSQYNNNIFCSLSHIFF